MLKTTQLIFIMLVFLSQQSAVLATTGKSSDKPGDVVKNLTVSDYLQKKKAEADRQGRRANHLINESSPYLLQHAYNPVNWYPWGEEAFARARKENKPIFLSIGYSTCHWCHVMARESFENAEIAKILNKHFISIKVDREQRPDIDTVYMAATQLINGHGGWPMSVFLDTHLRPFHAATYYPPFSTDKYTGLKEILLKVNTLWQNQPETLTQMAAQVTARISAYADDTQEKEPLEEKINERALQQIVSVYDPEFGGFSAAPKFPRPGIFLYLNRLSALQSAGPVPPQELPPTPSITSAKIKESDGEVSPQEMMKTTLDAMAAGGIYDQVGGGFHRYSVDDRWQVPHFEKMLYSQALMVMAYSDFYKVVPAERYKQVVYDTLKFVQQEMQSPAGGFYSALDADSDRPKTPDHAAGHAEGAYYLWSEAELKSLLSEKEFHFISDYYDIQEYGNILSDPQQEFTGLNILYVDEAFKGVRLTPEKEKLLRSAEAKLNVKRRLRPRPHLDDKFITAWNAMMIAALAKASSVFDEPVFFDEAVRSVSYLKKTSYDKSSGKLSRLHRAGQYNVGGLETLATLADYSWLIYSLLEMDEAENITGDKSRDRQSKSRPWLQWALELQAKQDELFLDKTSGAYFESTDDDTNLLFRSKNIYDDALPSANAIALANLRHLAQLSDKKDKKMFEAQADKLLGSFAKVVNQNPSAASTLLSVELR